MDPGLRSKNLITRMMKDGTELKRGDANKRTLTRGPRLLSCLKQNKIKQWRVGCGDRACTGGGTNKRRGSRPACGNGKIKTPHKVSKIRHRHRLPLYYCSMIFFKKFYLEWDGVCEAQAGLEPTV